MDSNVEIFLKTILDVCKFTMPTLFIKVINVISLLIQLQMASLSNAHCLHAKYYSISTSSHLTGTVCHHVIYNEAVTDIACGQNKWSWLMESLICVNTFW